MEYDTASSSIPPYCLGTSIPKRPIAFISSTISVGYRPERSHSCATGAMDLREKVRMPAFHVHAWGTVVALSAFWFLFTRRREWFAFFVPAFVLALPVLVWMWPPANNSYCGDSGGFLGYCIEPGWLAFTDIKRDGLLWAVPDFVWFWI